MGFLATPSYGAHVVAGQVAIHFLCKNLFAGRNSYGDALKADSRTAAISSSCLSIAAEELDGYARTVT